MKPLTRQELIAGIDPTLVENAASELLADQHLEQFRYKNTGNVNHEESLSYFLATFKDDLSFYKQEKNSGSDHIVLFKNCVMVGIADSLTRAGKYIAGLGLRKAEKWDTYSYNKLRMRVLRKYFTDAYDHRCRYLNIKPTALKFWEQAEKVIFN